MIGNYDLAYNVFSVQELSVGPHTPPTDDGDNGAHAPANPLPDLASAFAPSAAAAAAHGDGFGETTPGTPLLEGKAPSGGNINDVIENLERSPSPHPYTPPFSPPPSSGEGSLYDTDDEGAWRRDGSSSPPPSKRRKKGTKESPQVEEFRHKVSGWS